MFKTEVSVHIELLFNGFQAVVPQAFFQDFLILAQMAQQGAKNSHGALPGAGLPFHHVVACHPFQQHLAACVFT